MSGELAPTLSGDDIDEILTRAAELLQERHVVPEVGLKGAQLLRLAASRQRYRRSCDSPAALADLLTSDLRLATGDGHLRVDHLDDDAGPADDWIARWRQEGPSRNWGVAAVRLLAGNVGYLKITSFYTWELAGAALGAAMELVRHSDGLVLDLTDNGGGDDETADAVMETFLEAGAPRPLLLESRDGREEPKPPTDLTWPRYGAQRPLAIMIDRRSFSAPEAVAYALQQENRAVVVGGRSGGGANMVGDAVSLPCGLRISIPERRPVGRITNANWEGVGVQPDVAAPADEALWRAWELVRRTLAEAGA